MPFSDERAQVTVNSAQIPRRLFLRGAGAAVSIPLLEFTRPTAFGGQPQGIPRSVFICAGLGFHTPFLFPEHEGTDYQPTPYLDLLKDHREQMTLFSGLSHPEQNGNNGHASSMTWLTSARRPGLAGFKNSVSLDQLSVGHLCGTTRLPYLCLANDGGSLSGTASGVNIPAEASPSRLFKRLFIEGKKSEVEQQLNDLRQGKSILDTIRAQARQLDRRLGKRDKEKLREYFSAIRDLEIRIGQD